MIYGAKTHKLNGARLFPHPMDRVIARMPHDQRFEVTWHAPLGPWGAKGVGGRTQHDVIERHIDLIGASLPHLLELRAIRPTQKPAYKAPQTHAALKERVRLNKVNSAAVATALKDAGALVPHTVTDPIAGAMNPAKPTTVVVAKTTTGK